MTIFGIDLKPIRTEDGIVICFIVVVAFFALQTFAQNTPPQMQASWLCALMAGSLCSAMGINFRSGFKHSAIVAISAVCAAGLGYLLAWTLSG